MILRDGRNVVHDLGPRRSFRASLLAIRGVGDGASELGRWRSDMGRFFPSRVPAAPVDKRAYDAQHRLENLDHYRELERERARRYRERRRAA